MTIKLVKEEGTDNNEIDYNCHDKSLGTMVFHLIGFYDKETNHFMVRVEGLETTPSDKIYHLNKVMGTISAHINKIFEDAALASMEPHGTEQ